MTQSEGGGQDKVKSSRWDSHTILQQLEKISAPKKAAYYLN